MKKLKTVQIFWAAKKGHRFTDLLELLGLKPKGRTVAQLYNTEAIARNQTKHCKGFEVIKVRVTIEELDG